MTKRTVKRRRDARAHARSRTASARGVRVVLSTSTKMDAPRLARRLVDARVAACVTVVPGVRSTYRWKGKVERAAESLLVIKTTRAALPACLELLATAHPYEVPEALVLTPGTGLAVYLEWVARETHPRTT